MTRPLTSTELQYVRTDNQASALFLALPASHVVFAAQVDGTPGSLDSVVSIAYHTVTTGAYTDIKPMMTLWVGSAGGKYDLGIARIRKAADSSHLYIGETSSLNLVDGDCLTVVDDFLPWNRYGRIKTSDPVTTYADYDIDFSDQYTSPNPVANLGPDAVIYKTDYTISSGSPASVMFDGSGSYMPDGSGLAYWAWGALGSNISVISGGATQNPTYQVTAAGTYKIYCTLTATNGKSTTGWRTITVFDATHPPVNQFNVQNMPSCDRDNDGGWSFSVRMYDQAAFDSVKDRQQVILFARDWYGDLTSLTGTGISFTASTKTIHAASGLDVFLTGATIHISGSAHNDGFYSVKTGAVATALVVNENLTDEGAGADITISIFQGVTEISLGPITGRENIICEGWIAKESLHYDPNGAYVDFTIEGMAYWLDRETEYILGIDDVDAASTDWIYIYHMTLDFGWFTVLYWRSTLCFIADYYQTGDTRPIPILSEQEGSLWAQLKSSAWNNILAIPCCNRYGQLYVFIPPELIPSASRSGIPVVMTVTTNDTELGKMDLAREPQSKTAFLAGASGDYAWGSGGIATARLAYSPGHAYRQFGISDTLPQIVASQAQLNLANALYLARANNNYPNVPVILAQNNRFIDCAPAQFVYIDRAASDNPRDVEFVGNVIPNRVTLSFDAKLGFLSCQMVGYAETFEGLVVAGVVQTPLSVDGTVPGVTPPDVIPIPPLPPVPSFTVPPVPLPTYPSLPWATMPGSGLIAMLAMSGTYEIDDNGFGSSVGLSHNDFTNIISYNIAPYFTWSNVGIYFYVTCLQAGVYFIHLHTSGDLTGDGTNAKQMSSSIQQKRGSSPVDTITSISVSRIGTSGYCTGDPSALLAANAGDEILVNLSANYPDLCSSVACRLEIQKLI